MVVESPEVLNGAECDDRPLVLLPGAGAVVLEEPQRPRVLHECKCKIRQRFSKSVYLNVVCPLHT